MARFRFSLTPRKLDRDSRLRPSRIATATGASAEGEARRLVLDMGGVEREVVVHIAENCDPDDLLGIQIVVVSGAEPVVPVAVSPSEGAVVLRPDRPVSDGTQVV